MARYTLAYSSFVSRMDEVTLLQSSAAKLERADPISNSEQINALCRGAVVLLSSHLEAFIKELGELLVERLFTKGVDRSKFDSRIFYHVSKEHLDNIKDTADHEAIVRAIFRFIGDDYEYWSTTGTLPRAIDSESFNKGFANPKFKKIKAYFNRFGFERYQHELARELTRNFTTDTNMVTHLVDTRNLIAHGDPGATKTPSEVKDMVQIIIRFCRGTDKVFGNWCKSKYCAIR
ncbi:MAG: MAE_28990/MAE_18760 family HEPN-like nuclease [Ktedonobacteraceae bacterium]